jgi:hypothetical protein
MLLDIPIYAAAFVNEKEVVVAGGGGRGRSGVKNKLVRFHFAIIVRRIFFVNGRAFRFMFNLRTRQRQ